MTSLLSSNITLVLIGKIDQPNSVHKNALNSLITASYQFLKNDIKDKAYERIE
jgi:hypothetical protein